ncbi:MAG: 50S ribosomal protein L23 [Alphaproteobacteria bacterium]|nr:50S ribosomal protein L23 [Alphaproteobacteria bacterium]
MVHRYVIRDRHKNLSQETLYQVIKRPIVTEKSTLGREKGQYFFIVESWATKFFIKTAVEKIFNVKVKSVNTSTLKGKTLRFKGRSGVRSDVKKAMVSLQDGYSIDLEKGEVA